MRQTDLQILEELIADDYKPYIEAALKRIRSVYVESRHTVKASTPVQQRKAKICHQCLGKGNYWSGGGSAFTLGKCDICEGSGKILPC